MKYFILFLLLSQLIQAQDFTLFSTEISFPNNSLFTVATVPVEDGVLAAGIFQTVGYKALYLVKTSHEGEILWIKILDDDSSVSTMVTGASFIPTEDGHFAIIYSKFKTAAQIDKDIILMKLMGDGTILWSQRYGEDEYEAPNHLMQTSDGGYLITGLQDILVGDNEYETYYYVIKTQEGGFKLWDKRYRWNGYSYGFWAAESPKGGYLISGFAATSPEYLDTDMYVVRIDENGEEIWSQNYGGEGYDGAAKIFTNHKGNYFGSLTNPVKL